ncbi:MAG TPA: cation-translocating P-type ATPase [Bacillota bacterium]
MAEGVTVSRYRVTGLSCAGCAETVRRAVSAVDGVEEVDVSFATGVMRVAHRRPVHPAVTEAVRRAGYQAEPAEAAGGAAAGPEAWWRTRRAVTTAASGLLAAGGYLAALLNIASPWPQLAYAAAMAAGGWLPARVAWAAARRRRIDINGLMILAALGAAAIGQWTEGAVVVFLFSLGEALEEAAITRTRRSIRDLMALAPAEAEVLRDGRLQQVPVAEVRVGERVVVRPGARVPVDGRIHAGLAALNEAPITGEAMAVDKGPGDEVFAGSINENGYLEVDAVRVAGDTTLSRIIHLVEEAQRRRAGIQRWIDRFAQRYTPLVVAAAALVALVPPLAGAPWGPWVYRGLALLILACPCALVISTPVAVVSAIGRAARSGVLIKGGAHLEALARVRVVALDKTGTLTFGRPEVTDVVPLVDVPPQVGAEPLDGGVLDRGAPGDDRAAPRNRPAVDPGDAVLALAAAAEARSEHPLGRAVVAAARARGVRPAEPEDFAVHPGLGIRARVSGLDLVVGAPAFVATEAALDAASLEMPLARLESQGKTVMAVAEAAGRGGPGRWLGLIAVADRIRPGAAAAVAGLRSAGVRRVILLTGDAEPAARRVAAAVGVDEVRARRLPEAKLEAVESLEGADGGVLYVGDGINDAPALARASVGVAMGVAGTDTALESADVALMADDLTQLPAAIDLSRRAMAVVRQNVVFSLAVKALAMGLLAAGQLTLWLAIAADTGAALAVIANGLRLLRPLHPPAGPGRRAGQPGFEPDVGPRCDKAAPNRTNP